MTDIKILYDKIYSDQSRKDPKLFIDFYERNKNLIEGADSSTSNPDYDDIMRITSDYALSLSQYGSSRKAIPYLDKAIQLFKDSSLTDLTKVYMYEILVWTRGVENYDRKKYSIAKSDFQYLVENYPENDKYKRWLLASRTIQLKKFVNYLWIATLICFVWETMVNVEDEKLKTNLLIAGIVFFGIGITGEIAIVFIKSRIKRHIQKQIKSKL